VAAVLLISQDFEVIDIFCSGIFGVGCREVVAACFYLLRKN
jgi:hypothetical protein